MCSKQQGYKVRLLINRRCCSRPMISKGLLGQAQTQCRAQRSAAGTAGEAGHAGDRPGAKLYRNLPRRIP